MIYPIPNRKIANKEGNGHSRVGRRRLSHQHLHPVRWMQTWSSPLSHCVNRRRTQPDLQICQYSNHRQPQVLSSPCIVVKVQKEPVFRSLPLAQQMLLLPAFVTSLLCIVSWTFGATATDQSQEGQVREFFGKDGANTGSSHTNNWAVLVCASRYWFNYRVGISNNVYTLILKIFNSIWPIPWGCKLFATSSGRPDWVQVSHCETSGHTRLEHHPHVSG